jgi:hypothetical protein
MAFDPARTAALLLEGGLSNSDVAKGVAIVEAASSHEPDATHENSDEANTVDRGLWLINDAWHPEVTDEMAFDPVAATREAVRIKGSGDWTAWPVYKDGSWRAHRKLGWVALRLAMCQASRDTWQQEYSVVTDEVNELTAKGDDLSALLRVSAARVVTLDTARLSAIQRLNNV